MARTAATLLVVFALVLGGASPALGGPAAAPLGQAAAPPECPPGGLWLAGPDGQPMPAPDCPPPGAQPGQPGLPPAGGAAGPQTVDAIGGPDGYGYTWDYNVAVNPPDAHTTGTALGFPGGATNGQAIEVALPFSFKFYENTYNSVYVAGSGYVAFSLAPWWDDQSELGNVEQPNNVIAAWWSPFQLNGSGSAARVYYKSGGVSPDQFFMAEWYQVKGGYSPNSEQYTFAIILRENGDIELQYQLMNTQGGYYCGYAGIEDATAQTVLPYSNSCSSPHSFSAVLIERPAPAARVRIDPRYQGQFTSAGREISFTVPIRNLGEIGTDTFNLDALSNWSTSLYAADGVTPLTDTDTDTDTVVDTGPVAEGDTVQVVVKVQTPGEAALGDSANTTLFVSSSLPGNVIADTVLQAAVPAPFAQVYADTSNTGMRLALNHPLAQADVGLTDPLSFGAGPAIAATTSGHLAYAWYQSYCLGVNCAQSGSDIHFALLNEFGEIDRAPYRLTDNSAPAQQSTYDYEPAIAPAPDGRIGLAWYQYRYNHATFHGNYNVFFAVLNSSGALEYGPVNLTNNNVFGFFSQNNVPQFYDVKIAATGDNRFVVAWPRYHNLSGGGCSFSCSVNDIYTAVRLTTGAQVQALTKRTSDTAGPYDGYFTPDVTPLSNNRVLLTYNRQGHIHTMVLNSAGGVVQDAQNRTLGSGYYGYDPDAVQLPGGNILVAYTTSGQQIGYLVLSATYLTAVTPQILTTPAAVTGSASVSVTYDDAGQAVLTWTDWHYAYRRSLYYALLDAAGNLLTLPMLFHTAPGSFPYLYPSFNGYGNTTYSATPIDGIEGVVDASLASMAQANSETELVVDYNNRGVDPAANAVLTVILGGDLDWAVTVQQSQIAAVTAGDPAVFDLGDLDWLERGQLRLALHVPNVPPGTSFPITVTLTTDGSDVNGANNEIVFDLVTASLLYVPLTRR